ncbi:MAG: hypothetical protein KY455_05245 [Euryarchaeota archaeon]|nr:hypothetical protein [Euryarchaeota archaeon]
MQIGVPLVSGTDPVPLAFLDRLAAQASAEFALRGDPRQVRIVRLAAEPDAVRLWGGARVRPDALYRERPGLDVLVAIGPPEPGATDPRDEEAVLAYIKASRNDLQHLVATGAGVAWLLEAGLAVGRRVVVNHLPPAVRARYDAALSAHTDPARDGDLWTASDPPRFLLLLLEVLRMLGGLELQEHVEMRVPWVGTLRRALEPEARGDADDEEEGLAVEEDA